MLYDICVNSKANVTEILLQSKIELVQKPNKGDLLLLTTDKGYRKYNIVNVIQNKLYIISK